MKGLTVSDKTIFTPHAHSLTGLKSHHHQGPLVPFRLIVPWRFGLFVYSADLLGFPQLSHLSPYLVGPDVKCTIVISPSRRTFFFQICVSIENGEFLVLGWVRLISQWPGRLLHEGITYYLASLSSVLEYL